MVHKCLTSLPAFTGNCMHQAIERWFQLKRDGTTMTTKELYDLQNDLQELHNVAENSDYAKVKQRMQKLLAASQTP
jgi:hypothetical protein